MSLDIIQISTKQWAMALYAFYRLDRPNADELYIDNLRIYSIFVKKSDTGIKLVVAEESKQYS